MTFNLSAYLDRIGLKLCVLSLANLRELQRAQMQTIPFENIGPFLGEVPNLAPDAVWEKLVVSGRGGYCFELNGLFGMALQAAGFTARPILGRVRMGAPSGGPRAHQAWIVTVDGDDWLADVGFGGPGAIGPLKIAANFEQDTAGTKFRLREDRASNELVLERKTETGWFALYGFDYASVTPPDIEAANFFCARSDKSPFPSNLMLNLHRGGGRVSLFNRSLKIETNGKTEESIVRSKAELQRNLSDRFWLPYDQATLDAVWARLSGSKLEAA